MNVARPSRPLAGSPTLIMAEQRSSTAHDMRVRGGATAASTRRLTASLAWHSAQQSSSRLKKDIGYWLPRLLEIKRFRHDFPGKFCVSYNTEMMVK